MPKYSTEQINARRKVVAYYTERGYGYQAMHESLGISSGTLAIDLATQGLTPRVRRRDKPTPIDWRNLESPPELPKRSTLPEPAKPAPGEWERYPFLPWLTALRDGIREQDGMNVTAWAIWAARKAAAEGDDDATQWLRDISELLCDDYEYLRRLNHILSNDEYLEACRTTHEGREVMRLRAVR